MSKVLLPFSNNPQGGQLNKVYYSNTPLLQLQFHKKRGYITMEITNGYVIKEQLKKYKFTYSGNKIWYLHVPSMDILGKGLKKLSAITDIFYISSWQKDETIEFLDKHEVPYELYEI